MPGGLLNIISYGSENIILNGNPKKTFFKQTYKKHTNFGLQRFRIDYEGQRVLNYDTQTHYKFKIPKYAELLWDTYICVQIPNIYSSLYLYNLEKDDINERPIYKNYIDSFVEDLENLDINLDTNAIKIKNLKEGSGIESDSGICEFRFKWIKNLGFHMIKELVIKSNSTIIERYSGESMILMNERDNSSKKSLIDKMIGNTENMTNPGISNILYSTNYNEKISNLKKKIYPNCLYNDTNNVEPSIRGRKIYIPLYSWFSNNSKSAFPLIALEYSDLEIEITFRPVKELYTLYDRHKDVFKETIIKNFEVDISPKFFGNRDNPSLTELRNFLSPPDVQSQRIQSNIWNSDVHLISTYVFLSNEERKVFASQNHEYLLKNIYEYNYKNVMGSERIELPTKNLVSNYAFRFRRSDVDIRNQWDNYTNWPYGNSPINLNLIRINKNNDNKNILSVENTPSEDSKYSNILLSIIQKPIFTTGERVLYSNKTILKNMGILFNGTYRENILDNGIYNYIEKYSRTSGQGKEGIYFYNFSINSNRNDYQPSGSQNMNKSKKIIFEFNTEFSLLKDNIQGELVEQDNLTNAEKNIRNTIRAIRRNPSNRYENYEYDYELLIMENRYNVLYIKNGMIELKYAR